MGNQSSMPLATEVLAELKRNVGSNKTSGMIEQRIAHLHQLQQELQQLPVVGKSQFMKRLVYRLTRFMFYRYFQIDLELIDLSQSIYYELHQQLQDSRAQINRDLLQIHHYYSEILDQHEEDRAEMLRLLAATRNSIDATADEIDGSTERGASVRAIENLAAQTASHRRTPLALNASEDVGGPMYTIAPLAPQVAETVSNGNVEPPNPRSKTETEAFLKKFQYWYQRIYLGNSVYSWSPTFHENVWNHVQPAFPDSLKGKNVLDVGANAGFFSISASRLGAEKVIALEIIPEYIEQGEFCSSVWNANVEYRSVDIDEIEKLDTRFDVIIFLAILYHLKNPLKTLETVGKVCSDAIVLETEVVPPDERNAIYARWGRRGVTPITRLNTGFMKFIESDELNDDPSNWWIPDIEALMGMMRVAGFKYFSEPIYHTEGRVILVASKKPDSAFKLAELR